MTNFDLNLIGLTQFFQAFFYLHYKNTHGLKGNIQKCKINKDEMENLIALVDLQHNINSSSKMTILDDDETD